MKIKQMWIAFAVFLITAVGFRLYQVIYLIEPNTGFLPIGDNSIYILLGAMALYVVLLLLMSAYSKSAMIEYNPKKNIPAGLFALISSALLFVDCFNKILEYVLDANDVSSLVMLVFSLLAGVNFLMLAIGAFAGENIFKKAPVLSVGASVWACARAVVLTIIDHNNILGVSYNMLNIVGILALILFLFSQAKLLSKVSTEKTGKRCVMFGLLTVVFMSIYLIPSVFMKISNGELLTFNNMLNDMIDMSVILYVISFSIEATVCFSKIKKETVDDNEDEFFYENNINVEAEEHKYTPEKKADLELKKEINESPITRKEVIKSGRSEKDQRASKDEGSVDMSYIDKMIEDIVSKD